MVTMSSNDGKTPTLTSRHLVDRPMTGRRLWGRGYPGVNTNSQPATPTRGASSSSHHPHRAGSAASISNLISSLSSAGDVRYYPPIPMDPAASASRDYDYSKFCYSPFPSPISSGDHQSACTARSPNASLSAFPNESNNQGVHPNADQSAFSPGTRATIVKGKRK